MMGTAPPAVLGKRVGKYLRHKIKLPSLPSICLPSMLSAKTVAVTLTSYIEPTTLVAHLRPHFFKRLEDTDLTNWSDVYGYVDSAGRTRKGLAHKLVAHGETGAHWATDLADYVGQRRNAAESARVGKFKLTENSPNTARITVGPDQRQRRKKYIWERIGVQRQLATAAGAAAITGVALAGKALSKAGEGSMLVGARNLFRGGATGAKRLLAKAAGVAEENLPKYTARERGPVAIMAEKHAQVMAENESLKAGKAAGAAIRNQRLTARYGAAGERKFTTQTYGEGHPQAGQPIPDVHPEGHPLAGQQKIDAKTGKPKFKKRLMTNEERMGNRKNILRPFSGTQEA